MSSYTIDVSKDGKFLFRTIKQPGSSVDKKVENVVLEISSRFPKSEGFLVQYVEWSGRRGRPVISDVTQ